MPTLHIQDVPSELMQRLKAAARAQGQMLPAYVIDTLAHGQDSREARSRGGHIRAAQRTSAEQQAIARLPRPRTVSE